MEKRKLSRRTLLSGIAVTGATALAGCSGDGGSNDGSDGSDGTDDEDGTDGSDGTDGTDGDDGTDGTDGSDGEDGEDDPDPEDVDREVTVEAYSFGFDPGSEEDLVIQQGETIKLTVTAADNGTGQGHGLAIVGYPKTTQALKPIKTDAPKSVIFTADEAGEFEMYCTVQCSQPGAGTGHSNMVGTMVVEE